MSRADDNTVMEAVDSEVSVTCTDMGLVQKAFQLALLCTKRHPIDRPTMHEVARVLLSLMPTPALQVPSTCMLPLHLRYWIEVGKNHPPYCVLIICIMCREQSWCLFLLYAPRFTNNMPNFLLYRK